MHVQALLGVLFGWGLSRSGPAALDFVHIALIFRTDEAYVLEVDLGGL